MFKCSAHLKLSNALFTAYVNNTKRAKAAFSGDAMVVAMASNIEHWLLNSNYNSDSNYAELDDMACDIIAHNEGELEDGGMGFSFMLYSLDGRDIVCDAEGLHDDIEQVIALWNAGLVTRMRAICKATGVTY